MLGHSSFGPLKLSDLQMGQVIVMIAVTVPESGVRMCFLALLETWLLGSARTLLVATILVPRQLKLSLRWYLLSLLLL